jgi:hypothetical protein
MNIFLNFFTEDENLSLSYWHSVIYHQLSITIEVGCRFKKKCYLQKDSLLFSVWNCIATKIE